MLGDDFRDVVKDFASGVTVVTSLDQKGDPVGATVSAFSSLSLDPPLVLVCLKSYSRSTRAIRHRGAYVVHFLNEAQADVAKKFAVDQSEKFSNGSYLLNDEGIPCLEDCQVRLECAVYSELPGGDHAIFVGQVVRAVGREGFRPLVHADRRFARLTAID